MCGIVGYFDASTPVRVSDFEAMRDTMRHRGPDDAGSWLWNGGCVALGQRRLAIIDLSPGGHQPMISDDGRLVVLLNGEIYNYLELRRELERSGHRFRSTSDTEVLLVAFERWGRSCLDRLVGMFAFAVFDTATGKLFAARDRAGEKPFFYFHSGRRLLFASELKALLALPEQPRTVCPAALEEYLAYGYVSGGACLLKNYAKLPAGHWLAFDTSSGACAIERYWSLPRPDPLASDSVELTTRFEHLLRDSVRRQLVADVPVGILLSGGLDSSLVAATAASVSSRPIKTFTIAFPDSPEHDEAAYAGAVARHLGSEHRVLPAAPADEVLLDSLVRQFDEPIADSSMVPTYLVSQAIRRECTVALGGDGGDELFGGYRHYPWQLRLDALRSLGLHHLGLERLAGAQIPMGVAGRSAALALLSRDPSAATVSRLLDPALRERLTGTPARLSPETVRATAAALRSSGLDAITAVDFATYMCDDILVKVDRASMLASLEVRAPLLDHRIIEFAFRDVPNAAKINGRDRKILLRRLAKRLLPSTYDTRRKQGFSIPMAKWFAGPWKHLVDDLVTRGSPFFDKDGLTSVVQRMRTSDRAGHRLFQLLMLEAWRRAYKVSA